MVNQKPHASHFNILIGKKLTSGKEKWLLDQDSNAPDNTLAIGQTLFSTYPFPFEVASFVLLVVMIGAIVLAKREIGEQDNPSPMVRTKAAE